MSFFRLQKKQKLPSIKNFSFFKEKSKEDHYFYIDFQNQQNIITLEKHKKNNIEDQQIQIIGNNYITNLIRLQEKSFKLVRYLSQAKTLSEKRKQIERLITFKKPSLTKSVNKIKQMPSKLENKILPNNLLLFLQNRQNNKMLKSLNVGQKKLFQSISSISQEQTSKNKKQLCDDKVQSSQHFMKRLNFPEYLRNSRYFLQETNNNYK